jgi:hypothetical protein
MAACCFCERTDDQVTHLLRESRPDKNSLWFSFSDRSIYS